jgi:hypothetical protein
MRSLKTKLVLSALLGALTLFASPAFAQEPHHRHASVHQVTSDPVVPSGRGTYNMVITRNIAINPDDPTETGGGSVGYNEMLREEW